MSQFLSKTSCSRIARSQRMTRTVQTRNCKGSQFQRSGLMTSSKNSMRSSRRTVTRCCREAFINRLPQPPLTIAVLKRQLQSVATRQLGSPSFREATMSFLNLKRQFVQRMPLEVLSNPFKFPKPQTISPRKSLLHRSQAAQRRRYKNSNNLRRS